MKPMQTLLKKIKEKTETPDNGTKTRILIDKMKERTAMPAYKLETRKDGYIPSIFESKFGGIPYWDLSKEYPLDSWNEKMMLLAQINFSEVNLGDDRLPAEGILQFFIAANDDVYGMDFDEADSQRNFRIIYHEKIDSSVTKEQVLALNPPVNTDTSIEYPPITEELALAVHETTAVMGTEVCDFDEIFCKVVKEEFGEDITGQSAFNYLGSDEFSALCKELNVCGHWILGYPYFTQYDPRQSTEYYDTLLLQIDSEMSGKTDCIMWGDCGVANFFINSEALKAKDFSKVMYNWDCC